MLLTDRNPAEPDQNSQNFVEPSQTDQDSVELSETDQDSVDQSPLDRLAVTLAFVVHWILLIWAYDQVVRPVFNLKYLKHKPKWLIPIYHPGFLLLTSFCVIVMYSILLFMLIAPFSLVYGTAAIVSHFLFPVQMRRIGFSSNPNFPLKIFFSTLDSMFPVQNEKGVIELYNPCTWWQTGSRSSWKRLPFSLAVLSEDRLLVSAPIDDKIIVWDPIALKPLRKIPGCGSTVTAIAFSCNVRFLASASADNTVTLWNLAKDEEVQRFGCDSGLVVAIALSDDGQLLAWASSDGGVALRNSATAEEMPNIECPCGPVTAIAFSPDSSLLATASFEGQLMTWNVATREQVQRFDRSHTSAIKALAFNHSGRSLASASRVDTITIWNTETGQQRRTFKDTKSASALSFTRDDQKLVSVSENTIKIWTKAGTPATIPSIVGAKAIIIGFLVLLPGNILLTKDWNLDSGDLKGGLFWEMLLSYYLMKRFYELVWRLTAKQPLRRKIGLLDGQRKSGQSRPGIDVVAVLSFVTFIVSVIACVLWYQFRYDATGTWKPGWADILG